MAIITTELYHSYYTVKRKVEIPLWFWNKEAKSDSHFLSTNTGSVDIW